jgi:hypothetical protein
VGVGAGTAATGTALEGERAIRLALVLRGGAGRFTGAGFTAGCTGDCGGGAVFDLINPLVAVLTAAVRSMREGTGSLTTAATG